MSCLGSVLPKQVVPHSLSLLGSHFPAKTEFLSVAEHVYRVTVRQDSFTQIKKRMGMIPIVQEVREIALEKIL